MALKIIYQDYNSSFKELLRKDKTKINKNVLIECQNQKSVCILKDLTDRSSHWKCSVRKGVLGNSTKFTENTRARAPFLIKLHLPDMRHKYKKTLYSTSIRSSHQRCSVKKGVLRNFTKFTRKHLY